MSYLQVLPVVMAIVASFYSAQASFSLPTNTYCSDTQANCPANADCVLIDPCRFSRTCQCRDGYKEVYNSTLGTYYCARAASKVNDACSTNNDCSGIYTFCSGGTCRCYSGYTANTDLSDCTPPAPTPLGQTCTQSYCGNGARCKDTICQCAPGFKKLNAVDCTHYLPGDACGNTNECDFQSCNSGTCRSGSFQCLPGTKWLQTMSSPVVDGTCIEDYKIIVGSGHVCNIGAFQVFVCSLGNQCSTCPEEPGINVCIGGASGAAPSVPHITSFMTSLGAVVLTLVLVSTNTHFV